jgi:hypothetical protein
MVLTGTGHERPRTTNRFVATLNMSTAERTPGELVAQSGLRSASYEGLCPSQVASRGRSAPEPVPSSNRLCASCAR